MGDVAPFRPLADAPLLPHSFEAELALLSVLLTHNAAYELVVGTLKAEHFADWRHGAVYQAIGGLVERGQRADLLTIKPLLERSHEHAPSGVLADLGGLAWLARLGGATVTAVAAKDYARTIVGCYLRRTLIGLCQQWIAEAQGDDLERPALQRIEEAEAALAQLAETGDAERPVIGLGAAAHAAIEQADAAGKRGSSLTGVATGYSGLDRLTGGLERGALYVLGGRPAMGKTACALGIAHAVASAGGTVAFFSLEMSAIQLGRRLAAALCGYAVADVRAGRVPDDGWQELLACEQQFARLPFYIDDRGGASLSSIGARCRRIRRRHGLALIVVDHLGLVQPPKEALRHGGTWAIEQVSNGLKRLAKDADAPVLACCQLSRALEGREDKRPTLSDLRQSGALEQDADAVLFVYREHYYASRNRPEKKTTETGAQFAQRSADWEDREARTLGHAELIVAKQRDGPLGTIRLRFEDKLAWFGDLGEA